MCEEGVLNDLRLGLGVGVLGGSGLFVPCKEVDDITGTVETKTPRILPRTGEGDAEIIGGRGSDACEGVKLPPHQRGEFSTSIFAASHIGAPALFNPSPLLPLSPSVP